MNPSDSAEPIAKRLSEFIERERGRFVIEHNNSLALGFSDIAIYRGFLVVIETRHHQASQAMHENTQTMMEAFKSTGGARRSLGEDERELFSHAQVWSSMIRLETESWYLFAKILLDEIARCIEYYFGPARSLSLDSHDDFVKALKGYAASKNLTMIDGLMDRARNLKESVSDFRDYQIAHHKSPSTIRGMIFDGDKPESARMANMRWYPKGKRNKQIESGHLDQLAMSIDEYIGLVLDFFDRNTEQCALKRIAVDRS